MLKILIALFVMSMPLFSFAQKDIDAEELLKGAADKALSYKTVNTKFEFIVEKVNDESIQKYKGELWVKSNKFKMSVNKMVTFSDGKSRWVYLPDANEVNVSTIFKDEELDPEDRFIIDPMSIYRVYETGFKYTISGTQEIKGKSYTVISLSPEDIKKPYFKVKIWLSEDNDYHSVKYFQKDGTRITLQLMDFEVNTKIKDSFFIFKASDYKGVEVIDMRE